MAWSRQLQTMQSTETPEELPMTRIALIATAAVIALASPAAAGWNNALTQNGLNPNGFTLNGMMVNGFTLNGFTLNGFTLNGFTLNGFTLNGFTLNGLTNNGTALSQPVGLSLGGLDGMKVMSIELPR